MLRNEPMAAMDERRAYPRHRTCVVGKLVAPDLAGAVDIVILDLSEAGALVRAATATPQVPERVYLWQSRTGTLFECHVRWRKNDRLFGLQFTELCDAESRRALVNALQSTSVQAPMQKMGRKPKWIIPQNGAGLRTTRAKHSR